MSENNIRVLVIRSATQYCSLVFSFYFFLIEAACKYKTRAMKESACGDHFLKRDETKN